MTAALQTILPLRALSITRLMDVHCVRERVGLNEDEALSLARLEWGFDISGRGARCRELRLLPSVVHYFEANGRPRSQPATWQEVCDELLKGAVKELGTRNSELGTRYVEGTAAQFILNCSSTHLNSFIPHQLKLVPGTRYTSGPNGTPKITVESFLEFLRKRRVR